MLALGQAEREVFSTALQQNSHITIEVPGVVPYGKVDVPRELVKFEKRTVVQNVREYTPNVIEPSFDIGRIVYSLLEHVYWHRSRRCRAWSMLFNFFSPSRLSHNTYANLITSKVLSLPLLVASTKVLIVPLSNLPTFVPIIRKISQNLRRLGISCRVDDSGASIGKRYARNDELGIPLGITIDFDTVKDDSITLRERDSTRQVRASIDEIIASIKSLVDNAETWDDVFKRLPEFLSQVGND